MIDNLKDLIGSFSRDLTASTTTFMSDNPYILGIPILTIMALYLIISFQQSRW